MSKKTTHWDDGSVIGTPFTGSLSEGLKAAGNAYYDMGEAPARVYRGVLNMDDWESPRKPYTAPAIESSEPVMCPHGRTGPAACPWCSGVNG